jgi:hypothetical protein
VTHAHYITTDDKKWNTPLLYEISEIILLKDDDTLSYSIYNVKTDIQLTYEKAHEYSRNRYDDEEYPFYYRLACDFSTNFSKSSARKFSKMINDRIRITYSNYPNVKIDEAIMNICSVRRCDDNFSCGRHRAHSHFPGALYQFFYLEYNELRG